MNDSVPTRRRFLKRSATALAAAATVPYTFTAGADESDKPRSKNDRFGIAAIGMHDRGIPITAAAQSYGDVVAICDVDRQVAERARERFGGQAALYEDYRKMLDRKDVDVVLVASPDHWHAAMAIDACRAGKDVFCEKPLTLTVAEGKPICRVVEETGAVVQVGTWRRSDWRFRLACEMVRQGRLGKLRSATVTLGANPQAGPFENRPVPTHLNWDMWLGQTPAVPYCPERCHHNFRWWLEYSGGQMTDWGAHHIDIAQWGIGMDHSGPVQIDGRATFPDVPNGYNVPTRFEARMVYPNGVEMLVKDTAPAERSGILFTGEKGRIFVNRANVDGKPAEDLEHNPLPPEKYQLYPHDNPDRTPRSGSGQGLINHMANFFDCIKTRNTPISDVVSQHRTASTCHLGTISMRLGRKLTWDPEKEQVVGDDEANAMLSRAQRAPYQNPT